MKLSTFSTKHNLYNDSSSHIGLFLHSSADKINQHYRHPSRIKTSGCDVPFLPAFAPFSKHGLILMTNWLKRNYYGQVKMLKILFKI